MTNKNNKKTEYPIIVAMRGRNPENPSDRTAGVHTKQRLEPNSQGICNTLTSVQKDNLVLDKNSDNKLILRNLTPNECWSLMDFSVGDFKKAEKVSNNSNLYKQAGNAIVKNVLVGIIGQMIEGKEDVYKTLEKPKSN